MSNLRLFILIDDSLSMAAKFGPGQAETILIGAKRMVKHFLSQTEKNPRLEILIQAQSQFIDTDHINQLKFTRDWEKHRKDLDNIQIGDKSDFFPAITRASRMLMGNDDEQPGHLVYVSDGRLILSEFKDRVKMLEGCISGSIHFVMMVKEDEVNNELIERIIVNVKNGGKQASSYTVNLCRKEIDLAQHAKELFNNEFSPLRTKLKFGKLESELCVHPRPPGIQSNRDIFEILGIVNISDLAHPPLESRHLVQAEADNSDEPHLVVLLHRALLHAAEDIGEDKKTKLKVAVVKAGSRYGLLQPQETEGLSRKPRQWLAFWLFPPNDHALQWLGPLSQLGHSSCPDKIEFPIKEDFADKRSYITPTVAWARNEFIQTDLTKLFQKARRLPDRQAMFYRELNKIRKASLSYGCTELLDGIAQILEHEANNMRKQSDPKKQQGASELDRAARKLKHNRDTEIS